MYSCILRLTLNLNWTVIWRKKKRYKADILIRVLVKWVTNTPHCNIHQNQRYSFSSASLLTAYRIIAALRKVHNTRQPVPSMHTLTVVSLCLNDSPQILIQYAVVFSSYPLQWNNSLQCYRKSQAV